MLKNYLKIAMRNISKQKLYSIISIGGLAIAMACCILLFVYIRFEISFDKFHENADNIYRITTTQVYEGQEFSRFQTPLPLGPALKNDLPEVKNFVRLVDYWPDVRYGDKLFKEEKNFYADASVFEVFSFSLKKGDPKTALSDPYTVVINEKLAEKYFGHEEPLNKILFLNEKPYTVSGILNNIPINSHLSFDLLASMPSLKMENEGTRRDIFGNWSSTNYSTYVELLHEISKDTVEKKFQAVIKKYEGEEVAASKFHYLQPLLDIHFNSDFKYDVAVTGNRDTIIILSAVAFFILIMACINYLNLSVGMSSTRYREIGVRKVTGANSGQIFKQFLGEAIVICIFAVLLGIGIAEFFLPKFNEIVGRTIQFAFNFPLISTSLGLVVITCLIAGSIPAIALSKSKPVEIFQGRFKVGGPNKLTKMLVVFQFSFSIFFLLSTILITNQITFIKNRHLAIKNEETLGIPLYGLYRRYPDKEERYSIVRVFQDELKRNSKIISSTTGSFHFGFEGGMSKEDLSINGKETAADLSFIDFGYLETFNIKLLKGRDFSRDFVSDQNNAILINDTLAKQFGELDPIGKKYEVWGQESTIIGITEDFHLSTVHQQIKPLILKVSDSPQFLHLKMNVEKLDENIEFLSAEWSKMFPGIPFEFSLLRDQLNERYTAENRFKEVLSYASIIAVFLSIIGVMGLTALSVTRRTKEIGIRKVMGASVNGVIGLISKDFIKLVVLGNAIAWPVAYMTAKKWLDNFVYRTEINILPFLCSGIMILLLTVVTLSIQSLKTARTNPADILKYE